MIIRNLPPTSRRHYLTGMTAINIPSAEGTGDWHFHEAFFGYPNSKPRYFVAGVNFVDTSAVFSDTGVFECKAILEKYGVFVERLGIRVESPIGPVFAADHYRASADLLIYFLDSGRDLLLYSIDDWLSLSEEKERFWNFIQPAKTLGDKKWQTITDWFQREAALA